MHIYSSNIHRSRIAKIGAASCISLCERINVLLLYIPKQHTNIESQQVLGRRDGSTIVNIYIMYNLILIPFSRRAPLLRGSIQIRVTWQANDIQRTTHTIRAFV